MSRMVLSSMLALGLSAGAGLADRPVTQEEQSKLVAAVQAAGCSGGKLEFDDGKFEVDDATCGDGKVYDLKFDAAFKLIKKALED